MKQKGFKNIDAVFITKVVLVVFIVIAPFIDMGSKDWLISLNTLPVKTICIVIIVGLCFYDFTLALLGTVAFLIALINLNSRVIQTVNSAGATTYKEQFVMSHATKEPEYVQQFKQDNLPHVVDSTVNVACPASKKNDMNSDLLKVYVDDKIKPYDVYIQMMTTPDQLDKAQGVLI
jgi:hypothetical protein